MVPEYLPIGLSLISKLGGATAGLMSATYWIKSSRAKVMPMRSGSRRVVITEEDDSDVLLTMKEQNRLNAIAARWAAAAAIGVAISTFLSFWKY